MSLNDSKTASVEDSQEVSAVKPVSRFTRGYRSPLFNVILIGLISFTQFGIWNALNSTGAGGQQLPYLVNGANSLTYGIMVFGCSLFAILANKIGIKPVLIVGTLGYVPYSASLYVNNRYGTQWFVLFGGATCGIAASCLWATEGAIALGYADVKDRAKFTGIWLGLREFGQLIGAAIQLSLNINDGNKGKVGYSTYLALIGLQCLGLPLALMISPPGKVIYADGRKTTDPAKNKAVMGEFRKLWTLLKDKRVYLLIPILMGFQWNGTYLGIYQTDYFSVRARTLGSLISGITATFADIFWGIFFDIKRFSRPTQAKWTWLFFASFMAALFAWQIANEHLYSTSRPAVTLDWENAGFGRAFASMVLMKFMNESFYIFSYWLMGSFFDNLETLTLVVGIVRSFESVGSCLSFGIGAAQVSPMVNLIVAFVMFTIAVPATTFAVYLVPERPSYDTDSQTETLPEKPDIDPVVVTLAANAIDGTRA